MLQALSPRIAVALSRAQEARDRAVVATAGTDRRFWQEIERRWMKLAQTYEMAERFDAFIAETGRRSVN